MSAQANGHSFQKMLVYLKVICSILRPLGICCGRLIHFIVIWYIFPHCTKKNLATLMLRQKVPFYKLVLSVCILTFINELIINSGQERRLRAG
jgi:hypothetical protein